MVCNNKTKQISRLVMYECSGYLASKYVVYETGSFILNLRCFLGAVRKPRLFSSRRLRTA